MSIAICYYSLTISAIGIAAAGKIFWWFQWQEDFSFYHIAQNFIGIGFAALIPAFLIHSYEPNKKWLSISIVILASILYQGNINYIPLDPNRFVRFFKSTFVYGDIGSIGVFVEIVLWPIFWLLAFKRIASGINKS
ncbi:hypothetical protein NQT69_03400 [Pseudoalteromonas shioyasakiensis]|uniref:hypothetical protein n=1 Tax=Pseudoalteromonas shioyasakiensis TaxID=1190813 RepID=UPI002117C7A6|nr:hypothetical protein [Pseudoalteromonas shioyasakiensis]MCQ8877084.1 hypothetical protein [Pseudoalteromonas shioyasakiensis]